MSARALAIAGAAVLLVAALAFGGWQLFGGRGDGGSAGPTDTSSPSEPAGGPDGAVPAIAATVPDDIKSTGRLVIGVNVPYAPNEFKNSAGEIVGFDVDLMNAVAKTHGTDAGVSGVVFRGHHSRGAGRGVQRRDVVVHRHAEREQAVDFVTYFEAGTLWAQRTGSGDRSQCRLWVEGRR